MFMGYKDKLNTTKTWLYNQLFSNWKKFELFYVGILLLLQIIAYIIVPDSFIGVISGIFGVLSLVYGMKGRKITFIFGFIQCCAMTYIAWISHAYGSFAMDIIYVISQPVGWIMWGKDDAIHSFSKNKKIILWSIAFLAWIIGGAILSLLHGQLPYFDSINFVISFIAQCLYVLKYKENWNLWIIVNIANVVYWAVLTVNFLLGKLSIGTLGANLSQVALQSALLFNSIYANKVWKSTNE